MLVNSNDLLGDRRNNLRADPTALEAVFHRNHPVRFPDRNRYGLLFELNQAAWVDHLGADAVLFQFLRRLQHPMHHQQNADDSDILTFPVYHLFARPILCRQRTSRINFNDSVLTQQTAIYVFTAITTWFSDELYTIRRRHHNKTLLDL